MACPDGGERVTDLGARAQRARAVAIGKHRPAAAARAVPVAGGGDLEALHAARERERRVGLDHELEPALADDERDDPEVAARE